MWPGPEMPIALSLGFPGRTQKAQARLKLLSFFKAPQIFCTQNRDLGAQEGYASAFNKG